ncbi:hypothetical protein PUN28_013841 [Cardiocondyla obscurior]|uniref:Uncharacterized protein n=1 Tax=Cardiocondyla obscurior TaxID=286306 RepID=A0AAW2F993_9HYME
MSLARARIPENFSSLSRSTAFPRRRRESHRPVCVPQCVGVRARATPPPDRRKVRKETSVRLVRRRRACGRTRACGLRSKNVVLTRGASSSPRLCARRLRSHPPPRPAADRQQWRIRFRRSAETRRRLTLARNRPPAKLQRLPVTSSTRAASTGGSPTSIRADLPRFVSARRAHTKAVSVDT